jgi:hypothetical protein
MIFFATIIARAFLGEVLPGFSGLVRGYIDTGRSAVSGPMAAIILAVSGPSSTSTR